MQEVITIGVGIEATVLQTLLFTFKLIMLFFALMHTFILLRNVGHLAGLVAVGKRPTWSGWLIYLPTIMWTIFWILTQIPI